MCNAEALPQFKRVLRLVMSVATWKKYFWLGNKSSMEMARYHHILVYVLHTLTNT